MQITFKGEDKFEVKLREASVNLSDNSIIIDGFEITGPGEFERKGVFVEGIQPNGDGTIYIVRAEGISICYPGALSEKVGDEAAKLIGDVDVLVVPLGGKDSLDIKKARELIAQIDPRIVIPMLYDDIAEFKSLEGVTEEDLDTLKIKKGELPESERRVVVLSVK